MPQNKIVRCALGIILLIPFMGVAQATDIKEHKVVKGDTLWDISKQELKDPFLWTGIWKKNPEIKNPDRIYPDQIIRIPLDQIESQKKGEEGVKASAAASQENAAVSQECKKVEQYEAPEKAANALKETSESPSRRFEGLKGIILYDGSVIEGKILSMSADKVSIRMPDDTIRSYSFVEDIEDFIRE